MTPKEKANELIEKFLNQPINFPYIDTVDKQCIGSGYMTYNSAVKCAIIAVDEIITANPISHVGNSTIKYWQAVKQELENEL